MTDREVAQRAFRAVAVTDQDRRRAELLIAAGRRRQAALDAAAEVACRVTPRRHGASRSARAADARMRAEARRLRNARGGSTDVLAEAVRYVERIFGRSAQLPPRRSGPRRREHGRGTCRRTTRREDDSGDPPPRHAGRRRRRSA
jgi:hypothetical protein